MFKTKGLMTCNFSAMKICSSGKNTAQYQRSYSTPGTMLCPKSDHTSTGCVSTHQRWVNPSDTPGPEDSPTFCNLLGLGWPVRWPEVCWDKFWCDLMQIFNSDICMMRWCIVLLEYQSPASWLVVVCLVVTAMPQLVLSCINNFYGKLWSTSAS